jgi:hypothetical protein
MTCSRKGSRRLAKAGRVLQGKAWAVHFRSNRGFLRRTLRACALRSFYCAEALNEGLIKSYNTLKNNTLQCRCSCSTAFPLWINDQPLHYPCIRSL